MGDQLYMGLDIINIFGNIIMLIVKSATWVGHWPLGVLLAAVNFKHSKIFLFSPILLLGRIARE